MNRLKHQIPAFILVLVFILSACSNRENMATTMHLVKTEGTVQVNDAKGNVVELMENLGLYDGYGVATQTSSYGWISLDDTKLSKIDTDSAVEIRKDGKLLELYVQHGSLFFNISQPLEKDEAMDIRTSTMIVGIRGTCGWVEVENENRMYIYLLKGKVECAVLDNDGRNLTTETIIAGQTAQMVYDENTASITVAEFDIDDIPVFVMDEIEDDDTLMEAILNTADIDEEDIPSERSPELEAALARFYAFVNGEFYNPFVKGNYKYALVQMQPEDTLPTLLMKGQSNREGEPDYVFYIQYSSGEIRSDKGEWSAEGAHFDAHSGSYATYYIQGLSPDGNGTLLTQWSSFDNSCIVTRLTINPDISAFSYLETEDLWSGNISDIPAEYQALPINWYDADNLSGLDNWPLPGNPDSTNFEQ